MAAELITYFFVFCLSCLFLFRASDYFLVKLGIILSVKSSTLDDVKRLKRTPLFKYHAFRCYQQLYPDYKVGVQWLRFNEL